MALRFYQHPLAGGSPGRSRLRRRPRTWGPTERAREGGQGRQARCRGGSEDRRCCMKICGWGGVTRTSLDPPQEPHYRDEVEGPSQVQDEVPRCELAGLQPSPRPTRRCDGVVDIGGDRCLDGPPEHVHVGGSTLFSCVAYRGSTRMVSMGGTAWISMPRRWCTDPAPSVSGRSTSWPVKLGRMNERILRIEDHKGRIVRRGPAQTAALTRRGNTHHVLPMSLDCSVTHVPGRSSWRSRRWGDDAGRRRRATMGRLAWRTRSSGTRRSSETAFERAVPQGGGLRSSSRATSSITVESGSVRASSDSCNNAGPSHV